VLFHHAACVKEMDLPPKTEIVANTSMHTEDGFEADYWVWEEVPPPESPNTEDASTFPPSLALSPDPPTSAATYEDREITLQLDLASLRVHHITAVAFSADEYVVRRHRSIKSEPLL
jgi:hypothetical protein